MHLLLGVAVLGARASAQDRVQLDNLSGAANGILVDGRDAGGDVDDRKFVFSGASQTVGTFTASTVSNEVVAFTQGRPVALRTKVPWTSGNDTITLKYSDKIRIPVKVWIVFGPYAAQKTRALNAAIRTVNVWQQERMGLEFSAFEVVDATWRSSW